METVAEYKSINIENKENLWKDSLKAIDNKDYETAIFLLKKYISFDDNNKIGYIKLAFVYLVSKDYFEAEKCLKTALDKFGEKKLGLIFIAYYASALAGMGDNTRKFSISQSKEYYKESLVYLEKYLKKDPGDIYAKQLKKNMDDFIKINE